ASYCRGRRCDVDLGSFPTRRSSDLFEFGSILRSDDGDRMEIKKSSLKNELFDYCWPTRTRTLNKTTKMSCVTITPSAKTVNSGRSEETRLNSSHVKSSYAVFCVKKK